MVSRPTFPVVYVRQGHPNERKTYFKPPILCYYKIGLSKNVNHIQWRSQYGGKGAECPPPPPLTGKNMPKIGEKKKKSGKVRGGNREKGEKSERKGKKQDGSFT